MWFVSRRRHEQELAAAQNEIAALRRRVLATEERHDEVVRAHNKLAEDYEAEKRRADRLQERLDSAFGLNTPAVRAGRHWQATRSDRKKAGS
ncbi:hypothetical protein [Streptomyces sp. NPDC029526]|uniref:hypothetical protein n=1 Tax=Streptomyces sp. NPDC029526 TaxID=3155728 RepID=UPI0033FECFED